MKYNDLMEEMDVSISLIPVVGKSSLLVNAKTKPSNLDSYDWKQEGALAKRITIKWEEL